METSIQSTPESREQFSRYLKQRKAEIDAMLVGFAPASNDYDGRLLEAIRYPLDSGGKRIRPILVLMGADFCRGIAGEAVMAGRSWDGLDDEARDAILRVACSLEMIHTYSLVHDDLPCMDDDDLRRGRPTTHKVYGDAMAVLAGDALQTLGFQLIAELPERFARQAFFAMRELARASGHQGMVAGQAVDLEYENKPGDEQLLEFIHLHKTAALIRAGLLMGASMVDAADEDFRLLAKVGTDLGLIFQVVDDILDVIGNTEALGKQAGADEKHGKLTYPSLIGLNDSKERVNRLRDEIFSYMVPQGSRSQPLIELTHMLVERQA